MTIKKTKGSNQERCVDILHSRLDNLLGDQYLQNLPQDIKQKIKDFKTELKAYKIQKDTSGYKVLNGQVLDADQILQIILEASGYNKWSLQETEQLSQEDVESIKDRFGVSFEEKTIQTYRFSRSTKHRDDVNMVTVTAVPGYNEVGIDTDRAGVYIEYLVTPKEMKSELESNFD
jgi:superfamily I DNA/RNA helicase